MLNNIQSDINSIKSVILTENRYESILKDKIDSKESLEAFLQSIDDEKMAKLVRNIFTKIENSIFFKNIFPFLINL